jgi:organic hydroperoxide reductase OsmC/OhrA
MSETFTTRLDWTGAAQGATRDAAAFSRDLQLAASGVLTPMSSAPGFKGDPLRVNPEQLFVGALSACQALTYLFLAARKKVVVTAYVDDAEGVLESIDGRARMSRVTLRPRITLEAGSDEATARALVARAHDGCFIANSVTAAVKIEPVFEMADARGSGMYVGT